jgi:SNF2 family DNA or RNA helicase
MIVSEKYKSLILRLNNPGQVLAALPEARASAKYPGCVFVPHTINNVLALREMGFKKTPSPVLYDYDWPGRYTPYKHQLEMVQFFVSNRRGFGLCGMRSGKTLSALWAYDYLRKKGKVRKMLVVSPLSSLDITWGDTIFMDMYHLKYAVLHGEAKRRLKLFADPSIDIFIINLDGFAIISAELKKRKDIDVLCIDESSHYKAADTDRFRIMNNTVQAWNPEFLWMLSGAPTPNAPTDAWPQAKIMGTSNGYSYTRFKDATMQKISMYKWIPRIGCEHTVHEVLSPAIRFETRECIDLPDMGYVTRQAELSPQQKKNYQQMLKTFSTEVDQGVVSAVNEADKQNRLLQIICGFIYGAQGGTAHIEAGPRLKVLDECILESEAKVIVFVPYVELISILKPHLEKSWTVAVVDGSTSKGKRDQIFRDFQEQADPHILLAHPRTMSHSLTLTAASSIVWYAPYPSNETYTQANERPVGPKGYKTTIVHIEATSLEKRIYANLKDRQKMQGLLLDFIKSKEMS